MNRLLEYCKGDKICTMERLTTRNIAGVAVYKHPFECERCGDTIWRLPDYGNGSPTEKLADYEDAEEQGLLLRLKCKTGDDINSLKELIANARNKAIDDFIHECDKCCGFYTGNNKNLTREDMLNIAEQLKAGGKNE